MIPYAPAPEARIGLLNGFYNSAVLNVKPELREVDTMGIVATRGAASAIDFSNFDSQNR